MKSKFSSMWRVAIALVMVLSLGLMAAPVAAEVSPATVANVPKTVGTAATYTVSFSTNSFLATALSTITITFPTDTYVPAGTSSYDGKVTVEDIPCPDGAVTGAGQAVTITVPLDIPATPALGVVVVIDKAAGVKNPTTVKNDWKLTVMTSAEPVPVDSGSYATELPAAPTLTADITEPLLADVTKSVGQTFDVTAVVINTGPVEATTVKATIDIPEGASTADPLIKGVIPATLPVGGIGTVTWAVTCNAVGAVTIEVTPSGSYIGGAIPDGVNLVAGTINLTQQLPAALEVTDIIADPTTVGVGGEFGVTATVENTSGAGGATATDVKATIAITGPASLTSGLTAEKTVGIITGGTSGTAIWTVLCTGVGDVTVKVTAAGKDANSGQAIADATGETATVTQTEASVLEVTITAPAGAGLSQVIGGEFDVTATVKNTGASTAEDVALTITVGATTTLEKGDAIQTVGYLAPGVTSSTITWTLKCTAVGDAVITVNASGDDVLGGALLASDTVTVVQSGVTHIIELATGWNLISLPLIPADDDIGSMLASIVDDVDVVWGYDPVISPLDPWAYFIPGVVEDDLTEMEDGMGYWVDMKVAGSLGVSGYELCEPAPALPPEYAVVAGWNLIGYKFTLVGGNINKYLGVVSNDLQAIYGYKVATGYFIPPFLEPDCGYWIALAKAGIIYPNLALQTFTITATAGANGAISPPGAVVVGGSADQTFTITADNATYVIDDVLVDGASVGAVESYTFENVTADHTIHATFTTP